MNRWLQRVTWLLCVLSFAGSIALIGYAMRPQPGRSEARELYAGIQRHLTACRSADFPQAYHAAASKVQESLSLVQYEHKIRREYQPVAGAQRIEYGAVHHPRNNDKKVLVDVYFISRTGEATGWTYTLVYEEDDWKIAGAETIPGWPAGQRLSGLRI